MRDDLLLYILISQQIKICDVRTPRVQVTGASAIACWPRAQSSIWAKPQRHIRRIQPTQRPTIERNNPSSSSSRVSLCAAGRCVSAAVIYGLATMQLVYRTRPPTSVSLVSCWRVTCENSCTRLVPHCCYQPASIGQWEMEILTQQRASEFSSHTAHDWWCCLQTAWGRLMLMNACQLEILFPRTIC